jgi:hypothetical protein
MRLRRLQKRKQGIRRHEVNKHHATHEGIRVLCLGWNREYEMCGGDVTEDGPGLLQQGRRQGPDLGRDRESQANGFMLFCYRCMRVFQ